MHDVPYTKRVVGPEIVSSMTSLCCSVKEIADQLPCGVQILSGCNQEALAVAKVTITLYKDVRIFLYLLFLNLYLSKTKLRVFGYKNIWKSKMFFR